MTTTRNRQPAGRGHCADCGTDSALTAAGDVIVHGPRDLRCTGSGRPPRPPAPPLFVAAVGVTADTATEPSAAVEPASAPARYREGDRVCFGERFGTIEAVYGSTVEVTWDDGRAQTRAADLIDRVGRPEAEPVAEAAAPPPVPAYDALGTAYQEAEEWGYPADRPPTYTVLDEDDGEIDGGAVTPRAETSHWDIPAEFAEPSLLGPPQRSRVAQLEDEAGRRQIGDIEELRLEAGDLRVKVEGLSRKLAGEEVLCDRLTREASTLREEVATLRATLSQALALIGRLSGL